MFVIFVTDGHTVGRKRLTGCGDLASFIYFIGVSILITFGWVFVQMITTFRYLYYARRNLDGQTLWDGKKYRNNGDHNNKIPTSNDMPLFYSVFDQPFI